MAILPSVPKGRDGVVDAVKGFGIILVVLGHLLQYQVVPEAFDENQAYRVIYSFHMPLFFLLSGYVVHVKEDFHRFVFSKSLSLLLPFFFYFLAFNCRFDLLRFMVELPMLLWRPQGGLWFLYVMFWVSFFHALIVAVEEKRARYMSAVAILAILLAARKSFGADYIAYYLAFYFIGTWLSEARVRAHYEAWSFLGRARAVIFLLVFWALFFVFWQRTSSIAGAAMPQMIIVKFMCGLFGSLLCWTMVREVIARNRFGLRFFSWIGTFTLPIYAIHFEVLPLYDHVGLFVFPLCVAVPIAVGLLARRHWLLDLVLCGKRPTPSALKSRAL